MGSFFRISAASGALFISTIIVAPAHAVEIPKPVINIPKPNIPRPTINVPRPTVAVPKPIVSGPRPTVATPKFDAHKPGLLTTPKAESSHHTVDLPKAERPPHEAVTNPKEIGGAALESSKENTAHRPNLDSPKLSPTGIGAVDGVVIKDSVKNGIVGGNAPDAKLSLGHGKSIDPAPATGKSTQTQKENALNGKTGSFLKESKAGSSGSTNKGMQPASTEGATAVNEGSSGNGSSTTAIQANGGTAIAPAKPSSGTLTGNNSSGLPAPQPLPLNGCFGPNSSCQVGATYSVAKGGPGDAACPGGGCVLQYTPTGFNCVSGACPSGGSWNYNKDLWTAGTSAGAGLPNPSVPVAGIPQAGTILNTPCEYCPGGRFMPNVPVPPSGNTISNLIQTAIVGPSAEAEQLTNGSSPTARQVMTQLQNDAAILNDPNASDTDKAAANQRIQQALAGGSPGPNQSQSDPNGRQPDSNGNKSGPDKQSGQETNQSTDPQNPNGPDSKLTQMAKAAQDDSLDHTPDPDHIGYDKSGVKLPICVPNSSCYDTNGNLTPAGRDAQRNGDLPGINGWPAGTTNSNSPSPQPTPSPSASAYSTKGNPNSPEGQDTVFPILDVNKPRPTPPPSTNADWNDMGRGAGLAQKNNSNDPKGQIDYLQQQQQATQQWMKSHPPNN